MSYFTSFTQNVIVSSTNSSTTNLGASATFTGVAASTLGVNAIQVMLKTDQNCNVFVDQSGDGTNWDISDTYLYNKVNNNFGITVQAIGSYFRVRVTNLSTTTATTFFRLSSVLCPIVEAIPRSLDSEGNFKVSVQDIEDQSIGTHVWLGDFHDIRTNPNIRLVGTTFVGNTKDTNFWTDGSTGTGTVTQTGGTIILNTGAAGGTAQYQTVRLARWVTGHENTMRSVVKVGDTGTAGNIRRVGAFDANNGFFFELNASTVNIVSRTGGVDTAVASANWNVNNTFVMDTNYHVLEIRMTYRGIHFYIDSTLVHNLYPTTAFFSQTLNLPVTLYNSGGNNVTMTIGVAFIMRTGNVETAPIWKNFHAAVTAQVLKFGAGRLHKVCFNSIPNGTVITLYDALSATNPIAIISPPNGATGFTQDFSLDFYTGLTITTTPATVDITVVYE